jgi:hypothetical protein
MQRNIIRVKEAACAREVIEGVLYEHGWRSRVGTSIFERPFLRGRESRVMELRLDEADLGGVLISGRCPWSGHSYSSFVSSDHDPRTQAREFARSLLLNIVQRMARELLTPQLMTSNT